jgi:hypothetical protein
MNISDKILLLQVFLAKDIHSQNEFASKSNAHLLCDIQNLWWMIVRLQSKCAISDTWSERRKSSTSNGRRRCWTFSAATLKRQRHTLSNSTAPSRTPKDFVSFSTALFEIWTMTPSRWIFWCFSLTLRFRFCSYLRQERRASALYHESRMLRYRMH